MPGLSFKHNPFATTQRPGATARARLSELVLTPEDHGFVPGTLCFPAGMSLGSGTARPVPYGCVGAAADDNVDDGSGWMD